MANWALLLCATGFLGSPVLALVDLCVSMDDFLVVLALATVLLTIVSGECWLGGLDEKQK
jgi:hypothetical protein